MSTGSGGGRWGRQKAASTVEHVVDSDARLFLSLGELQPGDVELTASGKLGFRPTGSTPCVLHANGYKGMLSLLRPLLNMTVATKCGEVTTDPSSRAPTDATMHINTSMG